MIFGRKNFGALMLTVAAFGACYEGKTLWQQRNELQQLQRKSSQLTAEIERTRETLGDTQRKIVAAQAADPAGSSSQGISQTSDPDTALFSDILTQMKKLKQFLEENPREKIPELELLTNLEWLNEVQHEVQSASHGNKIDDRELPRAAVHLRLRAKQKLGFSMQLALGRYQKEHAGDLPADFSQLLPSFDRPIDPAILERYEIITSNQRGKLPQSEWVITEKTLANEWDDMKVYFKASTPWNTEPSASNFNEVIQQATWAFAKANERKPNEPAQLLPYLQDSEKGIFDLAALQRFWSSPLRRDPFPNIPENAVIHVRQKPNGQPTADFEEKSR
jgi:hypothetical protein